MKIPGIDLGLNAGTVAIGVAAYLFGPKVLSVAGGVLRSAAKNGIKGGMIAYHRGRQLTEEARASLQDMSEEAKSEIKRLQAEAEASVKQQTSA